MPKQIKKWGHNGDKILLFYIVHSILCIAYASVRSSKNEPIMSEYTRKYTKISGLRYREHSTRKYGLQKDKYFIIRYMIDGKRKEEGIGWLSKGWTEKKAAALLFELQENNKNGCVPRTFAEKREINKKQSFEIKSYQKIGAENFAFQDVFASYIEQSKIDDAEKTYQTKRSLYKKWIPDDLKKLKLNIISMQDVEAMKSNMIEKKMSPDSIKKTVNLIAQVFKYASNRFGYDNAIPINKIKIPKRDNKRERFFKKRETEALFETLRNSSKQTHDVALLSLYCGLRASEIFDLEWQDVNFDSNRLFIKDRKNKGNAHLPMHNKVREMLLQKKEKNITGLVFRSRKGKKIKEVSNAYMRAVDKLGFNKNITDTRQKVVFHTLRHTYASWLVMNDVDLYTVQRLLGHKDITMTQRYAHLAPEHLDKAVNALA